MYVEWVASDLPISTFWLVSPREYEIIIDGVMLKAERQHKANTSLAYLTAMLPWQKKPIPLEKLLNVPNKKKTFSSVNYDAEWNKWVVYAEAHNKRFH